MASDEFEIKIVIDTPTMKRDLLLVVKASHRIDLIKEMIQTQEGFPVSDQCLYYPPRKEQLLDYLNLTDYKVTAGAAFNLKPRLCGGAPKGVRKVTKQERLHKARASAQYSVTQYTLCDGMGGVCDRIARADYIQTRLQAMQLPALERLYEDCKDIVRNDRVAGSIVTHMVPELVELETMQEKISNSVKAIKECFEITMVENYFSGQGLDTNPFYEALDERLKTAREAALREAQQREMDRMQAQFAAQQIGGQAQAPADATMGS